jgi:hypothetical protein
MAIIVSKITLSQFQNHPVGATAPGGPGFTRTMPPVCTGLPIVTGSPLVLGTLLIATNGTWTGVDPITFTYQWRRNGTNIIGATSKTYTIASPDMGTTIDIAVTAHNVGGATVAVSASTGLIGGLLNQHLPKITGTLVVGSLLTTDNGSWVGTPPPTFTYSWQRGGVDILGATINTYLLVSADKGYYITSRVVATNLSSTVSAYSSQMGPVNETVSVITPPVITGEVVTGSVLSATTGTWTGYPLPTYTFQWKKDNVNIAAATSASYQVTTNDMGGMITCVVTASNSINTANATSNSIGPIIAPASLAVSNLNVVKGAAVGSTIGTFSVVGGTGSYTYTLLSSPSNQFGISGPNLTVATALSGGAYTITVRATGGVPSTVAGTFTVHIAALALSGATVAEDADIGTVVGSFSVIEGTGNYVYALTDPSGQFAISGSDLTVAADLASGSYPITIQATGGVPSPVSDSFMITAVVIVVTRVEGVWFNGLPYPGILVTSNKVGSEKYWFNGLTVPILKD